jgi:hypothetical protein
MAILDDHGLEVLRKAGELDGSGPETRLRVRNDGGLLKGVEYDYVARTEPTSTQDRYTFRDGGSGGTIVAVIDVTYETTDKDEITIVERTT